MCQFFRVPVKNKDKWMEIIKSSYPEGKPFPFSRVVVCDLHFDVNEIQKKGDIRCLIENALPKITYVLNLQLHK